MRSSTRRRAGRRAAGAMFNDPLAGDDLLQAVNRSGYQNERVANMPWCQEGALRLRAAAGIALAIGADHPHVSATWHCSPQTVRLRAHTGRNSRSWGG